MCLNGVHVVTATDKACGHKVRTPVGAPTNGRVSSHLGKHSDHCRAQGPSRDSLSRSKTTRLGAGSSTGLTLQGLATFAADPPVEHGRWRSEEP
jgi:hypothetical protein